MEQGTNTDKEDTPAQADLRALQEAQVRLGEAEIAQLFTRNRTFHGWKTDQEVPDALLRRLYEILVYMPTSFNMQPGRYVFLKSSEAKERLRPALVAQNMDKTMRAHVVVIIGYDLAFYEHFATLHPNSERIKAMFVGQQALIEANAFRNGTLQSAALMLAARALGLDVGPMSGFNNALVDETFFAGTQIKSNFLCNLGYGDPQSVHPRLPRLPFADVATIL